MVVHHQVRYANRHRIGIRRVRNLPRLIPWNAAGRYGSRQFNFYAKKAAKFIGRYQFQKYSRKILNGKWRPAYKSIFGMRQAKLYGNHSKNWPAVYHPRQKNAVVKYHAPHKNGHNFARLRG